MAMIEQGTVRNHLIAALQPWDFAALAPHLRRVDLGLRANLAFPGDPVTAAYFPESGYVSMLIGLESGDTVEVAMVGREGMVGLPLLFGASRAPLEALVQSKGVALRLDADRFRQALIEIPAFRDLMLRYAMAFTVQIMLTAACNAKHTISQRLARWLLMASDRTADGEFVMTHEFLSKMLGVRRVGVTQAAAKLQKAGLIRYQHGRITIVDRAGLEDVSCECYKTLNDEFSLTFAVRAAAPSRMVSAE